MTLIFQPGFFLNTSLHAQKLVRLSEFPELEDQVKPNLCVLPASNGENTLKFTSFVAG